MVSINRDGIHRIAQTSRTPGIAGASTLRIVVFLTARGWKGLAPFEPIARCMGGSHLIQFQLISDCAFLKSLDTMILRLHTTPRVCVF